MADPSPTAAVTAPAAGATAAAAAPATPAFDPKGKTLALRVDAFIDDVKAQYKIVMTKDDGRTAEWQQKYHVAHMFAFNNYENTTPKKTETAGRTIAWDHFSDPKLQWSTISKDDFLRTKSDGAPKVGPDGAWLKTDEPDKAKTLAHVKQMLKDGGIGSLGEAMVSSGLSPCAEPCCCGAGRSNHLSDAAADLGRTGITELETALGKLTGDQKTNLDDYLKKFGLHRPLKDHKKSPEAWHVEALSDT